MDREPIGKQPKSESQDKPARKAYRKPVLTVYGSISKLTRSGGSTRAEAGVPAMRLRMGCL